MYNPDPYTFIETYTGKKYFFASPTPDSIDIKDIAHALSRICRFTGHVNSFYSVASHSLLVASLVPPEIKLQALLHDATEAYVGDVSSPLKQLLGDVYGDLESLARLAICRHFNIDFQPPGIVKLADTHALYLEARHHFDRRPDDMPEYWNKFKISQFRDVRPGFDLDMERVEHIFLDAVERYSKQCATSFYA